MQSVLYRYSEQRTDVQLVLYRFSEQCTDVQPVLYRYSEQRTDVQHVLYRYGYGIEYVAVAAESPLEGVNCLPVGHSQF